MRKHIFKNVTGYCTIINNDVTVEIEYSEIPITGSTSEHYKATSVDCDYSDRCTERFCHIARENLTIEL